MCPFTKEPCNKDCELYIDNLNPGQAGCAFLITARFLKNLQPPYKGPSRESGYR